MTLQIIKYGEDPQNILRKPNIDVKKENPFLKTLISDMFETLLLAGGVGLAAPQVGKNLNFFIISFGDFKETFINPKLLPYGYNTQMEEGCLSVPGVPVIVTRYDKVKVQYYDKNWIFHNKEFDGILARIIQHEYDHLIGKLIIDY
jgi:peptide deformylase